MQSDLVFVIVFTSPFFTGNTLYHKGECIECLFSEHAGKFRLMWFISSAKCKHYVQITWLNMRTFENIRILVSYKAAGVNMLET